MTRSDSFDLAVIGGGAAGLMAVASAIEENSDTKIILIERNNELGKKVKISGGGRCNVTTGIQDIGQVLQRYPRGSKFLSSCMRTFSPQQMMEWVERHGVPLKVEADMRVFPCSDRSEDVVGIFENLFKKSGVTIKLGTTVNAVERLGEGFRIRLRNSEDIDADRLIIATGGQAYRQTGSTGDGYAFAQSLGHSITPLAPSLSSFMTKETWTADVSGLSFSFVCISASESSAKAEGAFLFTHKGISGPAVFALSSQLAFEDIGAAHPCKINIDLFPDTPKESLLQTVTDHIRYYPKKQLSTILAMLIPKSLSEVCVKQLDLPDQVHAVEISKKDLMRIVEWLKGIPLHAIGRGAGDEFVTAGGIDTKEVDPKTMQSKLVPKLYLAGEVLDIDGFTGGFNLQASWATGHAAGLAAAST